MDFCLTMLDVNPKHLKDPAGDVSARCNPIYVSRVVSAMVGSQKVFSKMTIMIQSLLLLTESKNFDYFLLRWGI